MRQVRALVRKEGSSCHMLLRSRKAKPGPLGLAALVIVDLKNRVICGRGAKQ